MADSWFSYLQIQICKSFELLENNKSKFSNDLHICVCKYENQLSAIFFLNSELIIILINYFALKLQQRLLLHS